MRQCWAFFITIFSLFSDIFSLSVCYKPLESKETSLHVSYTQNPLQLWVCPRCSVICVMRRHIQDWRHSHSRSFDTLWEWIWIFFLSGKEQEQAIVPRGLNSGSWRPHPWNKLMRAFRIRIPEVPVLTGTSQLCLEESPRASCELQAFTSVNQCDGQVTPNTKEGTVGAGLAAQERGGEETGVGALWHTQPWQLWVCLLMWPQESLLSPRTQDRAFRGAKVRPGVSEVLDPALAL